MEKWIIKRIGKENLSKVKVLKVFRSGALCALLEVKQNECITVYKQCAYPLPNSWHWRYATIPLELRGRTKFIIHAISPKCRADKVYFNGDAKKRDLRSIWDASFKYRKGVIRPTTKFRPNTNVCEVGIHFYFKKSQARTQ